MAHSGCLCLLKPQVILKSGIGKSVSHNRFLGSTHRNTDSQLPTIGWENLAALELWLMVRDEIARPTIRILFVPTKVGKLMTYWVLRHLRRRLGAQAGVKVWPLTTSGGALHVHWANEGGSDCLGMARGRWSSYWRHTRSVSLEPINQLR